MSTCGGETMGFFFFLEGLTGSIIGVSGVPSLGTIEPSTAGISRNIESSMYASNVEDADTHSTSDTQEYS